MALSEREGGVKDEMVEEGKAGGSSGCSDEDDSYVYDDDR